MNALNFQASYSQLPHMERFQQETHKTPVVNQNQNAQIAHGDAAKRLIMATEPEEIEQKKIDPRQRREENSRHKKNKKKNNAVNENLKVLNNDGFLDIRI
jgi:hypothetical protein